MSLANKPAFPEVENWRKETGMTLLQHFAGLAMQGLLASEESKIITNGFATFEKATAYFAVGYAKALIAELEKEGL